MNSATEFSRIYRTIADCKQYWLDEALDTIKQYGAEYRGLPYQIHVDLLIEMERYVEVSRVFAATIHHDSSQISVYTDVLELMSEEIRRVLKSTLRDARKGDDNENDTN